LELDLEIESREDIAKQKEKKEFIIDEAHLSSTATR
jgi:hypothetical protein